MPQSGQSNARANIILPNAIGERAPSNDKEPARTYSASDVYGDLSDVPEMEVLLAKHQQDMLTLLEEEKLHPKKHHGISDMAKTVGGKVDAVSDVAKSMGMTGLNVAMGTAGATARMFGLGGKGSVPTATDPSSEKPKDPKRDIKPVRSSSREKVRDPRSNRNDGKRTGADATGSRPREERERERVRERDRERDRTRSERLSESTTAQGTGAKPMALAPTIVNKPPARTYALSSSDHAPTRDKTLVKETVSKAPTTEPKPLTAVKKSASTGSLLALAQAEKQSNHRRVRDTSRDPATETKEVKKSPRRRRSRSRKRSLSDSNHRNTGTKDRHRPESPSRDKARASKDTENHRSSPKDKMKDRSHGHSERRHRSTSDLLELSSSSNHSVVRDRSRHLPRARIPGSYNSLLRIEKSPVKLVPGDQRNFDWKKQGSQKKLNIRDTSSSSTWWRDLKLAQQHPKHSDAKETNKADGKRTGGKKEPDQEQGSNFLETVTMATMMRMLQDLQKEVKELRQEVKTLKSERAERPKRAERSERGTSNKAGSPVR